MNDVWSPITGPPTITAVLLDLELLTKTTRSLRDGLVYDGDVKTLPHHLSVTEQEPEIRAETPSWDSDSLSSRGRGTWVYPTRTWPLSQQEGVNCLEEARPGYRVVGALGLSSA